MLVGCKKDLRTQELAEAITEEEGRELSGKIKAFDYIECSAVNNEGIIKVFETASKAAMVSINESSMEKQKGNTCCVCQ